MVSGKDDLFGAFGDEDNLDGVNYPMWSFMIKHVLVAKNLWNIVNSKPITQASPSTIVMLHRVALPMMLLYLLHRR